MSVLITSKGQATIPKDVRDHMGVEPGGRIEFVKHPDGSVHIFPVLPLDPLRGVIRYKGKHVTVEEMNDAIKDAAAERDVRSRSR